MNRFQSASAQGSRAAKSRPSASGGRKERADCVAFTLVELLVVVAIIGILAGLLLVSLRAGKTKAEGIVCLGHLKQFAYAWNLYADDHDERIPPNIGMAGMDGPTLTGGDTWVYGWVDPLYGGPDNLNTEYLTDSLLGPFLNRSIPVWRCPSYKGLSFRNMRKLPCVRSYSMNNYLNSDDRGVPSRWKIARRRTDLLKPGPVQTFVVIDEREDTINDCYFVVDMDNEPPMLASVPQTSHYGAGTLSFADGHAELHKWRDPNTLLWQRQQTYFHFNNPDVRWLQAHTTGRK